MYIIQCHKLLNLDLAYLVPSSVRSTALLDIVPAAAILSINTSAMLGICPMP